MRLTTRTRDDCSKRGVSAEGSGGARTGRESRGEVGREGGSVSDPRGGLFILGAPRSGTSWVQSVLSKNLHASSGPETHAFVDVVRPAMRAWDRREQRIVREVANLRLGAALTDRLIGLPAVMEEEDFLAALRLLVWPGGSRRQGADAQRVLIEKTPSNSLLVPYVLRVCPEAVFVHVIRHPCDVVRSLRAISETWGEGWAPRSVLVGSALWRSHVIGAKGARDLVGDARYAEVRYEDARRDPDEVRKVAASLEGRARTRETATALFGNGPTLASSVAAAIGDGGVPEPADFGDGTTGRPPLPRGKAWLVKAICADLMEGAGYEVGSRSAVRLNRVVRAVERRLRKRLSREEKEWLALHLGRYPRWYRKTGGTRAGGRQEQGHKGRCNTQASK